MNRMHKGKEGYNINLKFIVDESTGKKLSQFLSEKKFDVKFVTDFMPSVSDKEVLEFADKERRILITNDKDFGELIFRLKQPSSGVILLRLKHDTPQNRRKYVEYLISNFHNEIKNKFIVVREGRIRIRKMA